jgi:hypothetical protein
MSTLPYTSEEIAALLLKYIGKAAAGQLGFRNPVNQRGQSIYSASTTAKTYTIDRCYFAVRRHIRKRDHRRRYDSIREPR